MATGTSNPGRTPGIVPGADTAARATGAADEGTRRWTLLTRSYCHLCDDMRAALLPLIERSGVEVLEVDVDKDPGLESAFGERVPVLFAGPVRADLEVCAARLDRERVMAALAEGR
jgi:hypothetical protein